MKRFLFFLMFFLPVLPAFSQKSSPVHIPYIKIKDAFLVKEIEKMIQEEVDRATDTTNAKAFSKQQVLNPVASHSSLIFC